MSRSLVAMTGLVLVLAACESSSPSVSAVPSGTGTADQVLRMAYTEDPTLDPHLTTDPTGSLLVRGLTWVDEDLRIVPGLAESWDVTDGGTRIIFHLREASYSSGEPIVAQDFVYGWRRLIDPRNEAWVPYLLAEVVGAEELVALIGADPLPPDEEIDALLDGLGVIATDDRTLEVVFTRPAAHFVAAVSNPAMAPVSEEWITRPGATEAAGYWSSGPFVLTEWVHDQRRTLEPNPMWWGDPISLERIEMHAYADPEEALNAFRSGDLDLVDVPASPSDPEVAEATIETAGPALWHIDFDMTRTGALAESRLLREALSLAVDREELNRVVGFGGPVAGSPVPPGVPGHDPALTSVFDPDEARLRLEHALTELGLDGPEGLDLTFLHGELVGEGPLYLEQQWREELGIEVAFTGLETDQFLELVPLHQYDMFWIRWFADFPHPQTFLEPPWGCGYPLNLSGYCNESLDALLASAAATVDEGEQLELYAEAQRMLVGDSAHIFVQWPAEYTVVSPRVAGLVATPFDPLYGLVLPEEIRIVAD